MVDIARFLRLAPHHARVAKGTGDLYLYLIFDRFNPETGEQLEPERQLIVPADLGARRIVLQLELDAIVAIQREIEGLE